MCVALIASAGLTVAVPVRAEEAPSSETKVGPDIVRLKSGGLVRGTITELEPGVKVRGVSGSGKVFEFPMAEVAYAGPADERLAAPAAKQAIPAAGADGAQPALRDGRELSTVRLESEPPGLTFHRPGSSAVAFGTYGAGVATNYERLCTAPCEVTLPAGTETLALSRPGGLPREAGFVTIPAGRFRVTGAFESRAATRAAGWVIAAGSVVLGAAAFYASVGEKKVCSPDYGRGQDCRDELDVDLPLALVGALGGSLGMGIGLSMAVRADQPVVKAQPAARASLLQGPVAGATVRGTF